MRVFISTISSLITLVCFSQTETKFEVIIVDSGKYEFKQQAKKDTPDYSKAYQVLSNQVRLNPYNAELRYFLGYTIDRLNANDGGGMAELTRDKTIEASEQFEEVNKLEPVYKGEVFILDPYAKLTSIWGSLAQAYLYRKLSDSAKWAFEEGKNRGGFIEPILTFNRQLLNSCDRNAILITSGDNITIPIWYLQTIENYRTDITVVDANLVNAVWYPKYLKVERNLKLSFPDTVLDTIQYKPWKSQFVKVINPKDSKDKFSWELRPTYRDKYILRGDRILLDIFQQNFFNRPIYFSINSDSSYNLFLSPYLLDEGLINKVEKKQPHYTENATEIPKNLYAYNISNLKKEEIVKSKDAIIVLNNFRWAYFSNAYRLILQGNYSKAQELIKQMEERFSKDKLPFISDEAEKYFINFLQQVDKNSR